MPTVSENKKYLLKPLNLYIKLLGHTPNTILQKYASVKSQRDVTKTGNGSEERAQGTEK